MKQAIDIIAPAYVFGWAIWMTFWHDSTLAAFVLGAWTIVVFNAGIERLERRNRVPHR